VEPLRRLSDLVGRPDEQPGVERVLAARGTTTREAVLATLEGLDVGDYLRTAGVAGADLERLRARLVS
jgi:hypothetical protein